MRYSWENYYNVHSIFKLSYPEKKEKKKKKKVVQVKNLRKKSRKEGDRIHVKY